tara:strand:+ start:3834 stop:4121 length:288 start_codon:yes stop_codon:yes gene_type:complete
MASYTKNDFNDIFYEKIKNSQSWPGIYLFKYILPVKSESLPSIKALFVNLSPKFTIKKSSKNKYQSLTVKVEIDSAKSVVDIYIKTSSFKDVISL